ncbi:MAG: hypothetical protein ACTIK4_02730, partial [Mesonia sp.]|uniref:hypothetical protein n=1 Tax=Mesonia sp. TaxID=1960830 RepID=UPI003F946221
TKILADFLFGFYLLNYVLNHATNHTCTESNERLKIVTQLFIRWWNRPTDVVLQGIASNHNKVLW